jgi:hypothetical protein
MLRRIRLSNYTHRPTYQCGDELPIPRLRSRPVEPTVGMAVSLESSGRLELLHVSSV